MSLPLFHAQALPAVGQSYRLDGPEGRHAADVQRLRVGERLRLGDGLGAIATCEVVEVGKGFLVVLLAAVERVPAPSPRLIVAQGLPKGDRAELAVQAMTEVGVDEIIPWQAGRAIVVWKGDRGAKSTERWRSVAREAGKQSRRAWFPTVTEVASTSALRPTFVLHEEATVPLSTVPLPDGDLTLVIGPEGGISEQELAVFVAAGAVPVLLGSTVLRTSTAGVAALSVLSARMGRW